MTRQRTVRLYLTTGEVDVLAAIARDGGRRETEQAALIYRLRREYRKACKAAGIDPDPRLLYYTPDSGGVLLDERSRLCATLGDILTAVQDATRRGYDPYWIDDPEPDYEDWEDEKGGIECWR